MSVNRHSAERVYRVIRRRRARECELHSPLGGEVECDESYFGGRRKGPRGRGAAGKVPVFGLLKRDGKVYTVALVSRGDMIGAEGLARQLKNATSMLKAYPVLVEGCVRQKDQGCAARLASQALSQLKGADAAPQSLEGGVNASRSAGVGEFDPVLSCLNRLAKVVAPISSATAFEVLDEVSLAANRSSLDTGRGYTGIDVEVFRMLACLGRNVREGVDALLSTFGYREGPAETFFEQSARGLLI